MLNKRHCGILLHPTSLPGAEGIGTLGDDAWRFVNFLGGSGISIWQVLPLTPPAAGNSPYSAFSAFAGNPLLIDLEHLVREGDLPVGFTPETAIDEENIDFGRLLDSKLKILHKAATTFLEAPKTVRMQEFWHFCDTTEWLHDYALFMALKRRYKGKIWQHWPADIALITPEMYEKASLELGPEIGAQKYMQWQFHRQWQNLKKHAAGHGITIIGDLPIFVAYDSADVWRNRELFLLDTKGNPTVMAGVPPDYFSETGQLWGNPLYDWKNMEISGYAWWIKRFKQMFELFDCVRVDHFRGFEAAWQVPAGERTAVKGTWVKGPGELFFDAVSAALGTLPIIAEDLGVITPEVEALRDHCGYPGMKILQFAFDSGPSNPYLPHNFEKNYVVYTGTHDNDTTLGWYHSLNPAARKQVLDYLASDGQDIVGDLIRVALMSVANTVILPLQDLLRLPSEARMNTPGTATGNWGWRFSWSMISRNFNINMAEKVELYGRRQ
ncbi:MAG TPA: 4-alpha-glucanotransferase [Desulfuromonadaceae bacterium]|jgi:4-alpha-glucanotransferase